MKISKTGALGHFLVHGDMVAPTAIALTIAELHKREAKDDWLLRLYDRSHNIKVDKSVHLEPFFGVREDLMSFQSRKMNRSLLTYFYYSVVEGKRHADIAYELSQRMRGHKDLDSTSTYIVSTNKDGSIDRVSLNLANRGHFGWLYNLIVQHYFDSASKQSLEERTAYIMAFREEFTPQQLELVSRFLKESEKARESLALRVAKMTTEEITQFLNKISKGELPSKMKNAQCFVYPECSYPTANSCLHCENIIPRSYLLISINQELNRLIDSICATTLEAIAFRDYKILTMVLDLLKQAEKQFGRNFIQSFINLEELKNGLLAVHAIVSKVGALENVSTGPIQ
ncbi:hypothetical protein [Gordoniibacillus kamchatkensis]|nr:hypothetical protein [Paenibacillus sp. VKM B-2647]